MASNTNSLSNTLVSQLLLSDSVHNAFELILNHYSFLYSSALYKKNDLSWSAIATARNYKFDCQNSVEFEEYHAQQNIHRLEFNELVAKTTVEQNEESFFYIAKQELAKDGKAFSLVLCGSIEKNTRIDLTELASSLAPILNNLYQIQETAKALNDLSLQNTQQAEALNLNRSLLDNVGDAVFYHDDKGRFLDVNLQAIISLGYSKAELLNKRVKDIDIGVNEGISLTKLLREKIKPGQPSTIQSWHLRKDGSRFPVEVTVSSHETGNFLAVARDISKRTQIRAELEKTKDFLESVIDLSESLIYVYDYSKDKIIKGANKLENALGYPTGKISNLNDLLECCHPDDIDDIKKSLAQVYNIEHKGPIEFDDRVLDAHGKWRWVRNHFRVFERAESGQPKLVIATATDVTKYKLLEGKLVKSQNKYRALVENSFDAIAVFDKDNQVSYASSSAYRMLDYKVGDATNLYFDDFVHSDDRQLIVDAWRQILDSPSNPVVVEEVRLLKKTGKTIWAKATLNNLLYDDFVQGIVANFSDLTKEKTALSEVDKKERYYKSLVEKSFDGVALYDADGEIKFVSDKSKKLLGYGDNDVAPQYALEYVYPEDLHIPKEAWVKLLLRPFDSIDLDEYRLLKKDGSTIWIQNTLTNLLEDPNVRGIVSNFRDVSSRKNTELSLYKVSNYDSVSGLPNRKFLLEQLKQQVKKSSKSKGQFGLVTIDINALNAINTAHGHAIGDAVILKVAEAIKNTVSASDFVAKIGDDEYGIIFSNQSTYEVSRKCQEILEQFKNLIEVKKSKVKVSLTAGISIFPKDALNSRNLISHAEIALKRAKSESEPFAFYKNHDSEITRYRLDLEKDLLEALANNELYMVYQPIIDCQSGEIMYLESLLRWLHPEKGNIPPNLFVKIAEESNLIGRLSEWVIEAVVNQISNWNAQGLYPKVTVNLSPKDIRRKNISDSIMQIITGHQVEPSSLAVEITESEELLDLDFVRSQMNELNQLGVSIILDDFGTGFSSVSHLLNLPISAAKIDKSFIHRPDASSSQEVKNFLNGIINLIQGSGMATIVEGVETVEQFEHVRNKENLYCQGYLFSKPKEIEQITELLRSKKISLAKLGSNL